MSHIRFLAVFVLFVLMSQTAHAGFVSVSEDSKYYDSFGSAVVGNVIVGSAVEGSHYRRGDQYRFFSPSRSGRGSFTDVADNHENAEAIAYVARQGIMGRFVNNTFRPNDPVTRGEFTAMIADRVFSQSFIGDCFQNISAPFPPGDFLFTDVEKKGDEAERICAAAMANIIHGYGDGSFKPDQPINFAEASKIVSRAYDVSFLPHRGFGNEWFKKYVSFLADRAGIPLSIGGFDHIVTRADAAELIYRVDADVTDKPSLEYSDLIAMLTRAVMRVIEWVF